MGYPYLYQALAICYCNGIGVKQDKHKALNVYQPVANKGRWSAYSQLRRMHMLGEGTRKSGEMAVQLFETLANYEQNEAHWNLGLIYDKENGFRNENRAISTSGLLLIWAIWRQDTVLVNILLLNTKYSAEI